MDCCAPNLNAETLPFEFLALFGVGFLISLGHCIGMCGPLQGAFALTRGQQGQRGWRLLITLLVYHGGRLFSYGLLGTLFGLVGAAVLLGSNARSWQGGLSLFAGMIMLPLGFGLMGWLPTVRWMENNPVSRRVTGLVARLLASPASSATLVLGLANGFLPCGPVYTAGLTAASTGNPWQGFLAMIFYGMGTVPVMLAFGLGGTRLLQSRNRPLLQKIAALLVLVIGIQLMMRGMAAFDLVPHLKFGEVVFW
jgi:uncharacterized protein